MTATISLKQDPSVERRRLEVAIDDVLEAMTVGDTEPVRYVLDLETGKVESQFESELLEDDLEETDFDRAIEENPDRYEEIPRYAGRDEYRLMCSFADAIDEDDIRDRVGVALQGKGAFRRFRDVVFDYPDLQTKWLTMRQEALLREARDWLESLGIDPIGEPRPIRAEPSAQPAPRTGSAPKITLIDMLLLGAPDGKTELLNGKVWRQIDTRSPTEARSIFKNLARELCEHHGVAWRNRFIEDTSRFEMERAHVEIDGTLVRLSVEVTPAMWKAFGG